MPLANGPITTVSAMIPRTPSAPRPVIRFGRSGHARSTMTTSRASTAVSATGAKPRMVVWSKAIIAGLLDCQLRQRSHRLEHRLDGRPKEVEQQIWEDAEGDG